jgi:hypothetical protein
VKSSDRRGLCASLIAAWSAEFMGGFVVQVWFF